MQRGEVPVVSGVGVCPVLYQRRDDFGMPEGAGVVQGDQSTLGGKGMFCMKDTHKYIE